MTIEEKIKLITLYDIYYELFSVKQQQIFEMFYDDDCLVSEIAISLNTSKPYISTNLKNTKEKLLFLESVLKIQKNYESNISTMKKNGVSIEIINKIKK